MKYLLAFLISLISHLAFGQAEIPHLMQGTEKMEYLEFQEHGVKLNNNTLNDTITSNPNYDKALAEKLGGDDYGMKSYFFVLLKTGKNVTTNNELISESFKGHLDNINQLAKENKLVVAGPLGQNERNYRGIFILNDIESEEEVKALLQTDPAIKNGMLDFEIFTWYGSAALPEYLPISDKIWNSKP